ncbi:hypothetical protein KP509_04G081700 [Ceratopteris richardii]|uniref:GDSL esterase/lipase n=1 Tax=Ceratopteris richardii TaxID=49495 RepID=A0A8T2UXF0_CERRI|nr:hypothetical protein KP509_04G081700 [Ceratopteris richardii]
MDPKNGSHISYACLRISCLQCLTFISLLLYISILLVRTVDAHEVSSRGEYGANTRSSKQKSVARRLKFRSMFALGDSITDTGNLLFIMQNQNSSPPVQGRPPYGETFFQRPTGRFSDGRLIVDFLAKELEASDYLAPSLILLNQSRPRQNGLSRKLVNFAVAGATALPAEYFNVTYNIVPYTYFSLNRQLEGITNETRHTLSRALVFVGEIGGNDYNYAFGNSIPLNEIFQLVPNVVSHIGRALELMILGGVKYVVVQNASPVGCIPLYRRMYQNATKDDNGCIQDLNNVLHLHNLLLSQLLNNLTTFFNASTKFVLWDTEKAFMEVFTNPYEYGFSYIERPCYNITDYFLNLNTNLTNVEPCVDPSVYISWDGPHQTEAMNNIMFDLFYKQGYATPFPNFLTTDAHVMA